MSILQICTLTQQRCGGPYQQWDSIPQCVASLSEREYGNYGEAWGDNIVCRTIHLVLTLTRPDVNTCLLPLSRSVNANTPRQIHCPHVGPSGGGKCVDIGETAYLEDERLYGAPAGDTFMC